MARRADLEQPPLGCSHAIAIALQLLYRKYKTSPPGSQAAPTKPSRCPSRPSSLARLVAIEVWSVEPVDRFITFILTGVALLSLGFIYTRYQDKLRRIF